MQLYFDIDPTQKENYKIKKEPVNFLTRVLESVNTVIDVTTDLTRKTIRKKDPRAKKNRSMVMQDFFGALNY
jgi:hypothetical protein